MYNMTNQFNAVVEEEDRAKKTKQQSQYVDLSSEADRFFLLHSTQPACGPLVMQWRHIRRTKERAFRRSGLRALGAFVPVLQDS
jgi:hypothetical protein